ncbi:hypothetical protein J6590_017530 [Homalodisca vitripennis]|nr:hypothetical protein J6590_017530 [Homalodisca vitripennis]
MKLALYRLDSRYATLCEGRGDGCRDTAEDTSSEYSQTLTFARSTRAKVEPKTIKSIVCHLTYRPKCRPMRTSSNSRLCSRPEEVAAPEVDSESPDRDYKQNIKKSCIPY